MTYGCEVFLDGRKVGEHHGPQVPFEMDLTYFVTPGKEQTLQVKAFQQLHYRVPASKYPKFKGMDRKRPLKFPLVLISVVQTPHKGNSKVAYGITRSIQLDILPPNIEETFVRPSVTKCLLACDVWLHNTSSRERTLRVQASLSSWNKHNWDYPAISSAEVTIPAGSKSR